MADCSELAQTITDLAMTIASDPNVNTLDAVVAEMKKDVPGITRELVVDSITEATEGRARQTDALVKKLNEIKREARGEKGLQRKIGRLEQSLKAGKRAESAKQRKIGSDTTERLRKTSKNLTRWLKNNNPTAEKRLQKKLAELQNKIVIGDLAAQRKPKTEFREPVKRLQAQINDARKTITDARAISKVEKQIDSLNKHLDEGTLPDSVPKKDVFVSEPMRLAREIRDELKKKIAKSEPAQKKRLQAQIETLTKRIESGDILPAMKPATVPQSKELERLQFQRDELQRDIRRRIQALKPRSIFGRFVQDPFNAARNIITAFDLSAVLRQGGFIGFGRPVTAAKALGPMFRAFGSKKQAIKINAEIQDRPNAPLYRKTKLFLAPIDGSHKLSEREETLQSNLIDVLERFVPGLAASNRAYVTFLNVLRADTFDIMSAGLSKDGDVTLDEAKAVSNFVNAATGRGTLGKFDQAATGMNVVFFAPRYVASRFQLLLGQPFFGGNARTRKAIAKEYARYLIGMATVYALAGLTLDDEEFEWDPRSSDFGKIKIGRTRLDPVSGISQVTVFLSRVISGKMKSSVTGEITPIRGEDVGFGRRTTVGVIGSFLRYKLSPMFGTVLNLLEGKDPVGQPFGPEDLPRNLLVPLAMREVFETIQEQGLARGTALSVLAIFGMGIQTYGSTTVKKKKRSGFIREK